MYFNKIENCVLIQREKRVIKKTLEESRPHVLQKASYPAKSSSQDYLLSKTIPVCNIVLYHSKLYYFNFLVLLSQKLNEQPGTARQAVRQEGPSEIKKDQRGLHSETAD